MKTRSISSILVPVAAMIASPAALAEGSCSQAKIMKAVQASYGASYKYASDNSGNADAPPTFIEHRNSDQYVFWVDKDGNTFKAVVTSDSGRCTHLRAFVDVENGQ